MNKTITIKLTLFLFFILVCRPGLYAQVNPSQGDTTKKIVVVRPWQTDTQPASSTTQPNKNPAKTAPANTAPLNTAPANTAPANNAPANTAPVKTNVPVHTAPTTAERTGYPAYMHPSTTPAKTQPSATAPGVPVNTGKADIPVKVAATPPVKAPVKKDTVYITKRDTVYLTKTGAPNTQDKPVHSYSSKAVFGEIGGPGLAISANYDTRFSGGRDGLGFRIGAGYFASGGNTVFTAPIQVNYLIGTGKDHIELGAGTTFLNSTGDNTGKTFIFDRVTGFVGTATIGYRYQSETSGLNFRLGFVPILYDYGIIYAGGVSIGYTFRSL